MVDDGSRGSAWPFLVDGGVTENGSRPFVLPTGTVTFLLSDVEGSTRRWEAAPEAMTVAITRHDELLNSAIVAHGGVRPVEQGEGDSVVAAFSRASEAVAAALDVQRAFAAEDWPQGAELRVRIAVHTGEAQLRDAGNYVGHVLNRTARIRDVGYGGQVLLSAATAELTADVLPSRATIDDLGRHRLKDLARPEQIWQLAHPDLQAEFPPLRSLDTFRHNLPVQLSSLIGRTTEVAEVEKLLTGDRLVSLTGSAGVGKTRLALAVAAEMVDACPAGVWLVELAPVTDPGAVTRAVSAAVRSTDVRDAAAISQLAAQLGDQPSLLVLDNCEHVIDVCAELVAGLLAVNPSTRVLTTSREPLGVPGEITFRVPSLSCPEPERALDIPTLSQYDAVMLFIERARRARPSFAVNENNCAAIAQICQRLDGIPLALELAAARCRQMSAQHVAAELDDRFRLLTGGARTVMPRQQTLAASVDWSYERLDEAERETFRRLGVFTGPFPLEAAETVVAAAGGIDSVAVFDIVSRLVDKSLVAVEENRRHTSRYRLLETLRAYALERARAADEVAIIRDAHAAWWSDWLGPLGAVPTDAVIEDVAEFHANLVAALEWSCRDPVLGLPLLTRLARVWESLGRAGDAMAAVERLLTDDNAHRYPTTWLPAATSTVFLVFTAQGDAEAAALLKRAEDVARQHGDEYHATLARVYRSADDRTGLEHVRDVARERGDHYIEAEMTARLAFSIADADPVAAAPVLADLTAAGPASGSRNVEPIRLATAMAARSTGDLYRCIDLTKRLLDATASGPWPVALRLLAVAGQLARDERALRLSLDIALGAQQKNPGFAIVIDEVQHRLALLDGQPGTVNPSLTAAEASWPTTSAALWLAGREAVDAEASIAAVAGVRALARDSPHGQAVLAAVTAAATADDDAWQTALQLALQHDLRLIAADALEGLAVNAARAESCAECLRLLAAADRLRDETGYEWRFGFETRAIEAARNAALDAHGNAASAAITEGAAMDWREAAAYVRRARGERKRPRHGWASLTPTEQQVVNLVADGLTNPQIAGRLYISRTTVKTHIEHVFTKLGVRTRTELAAEAVRRRNS